MKDFLNFKCFSNTWMTWWSGGWMLAARPRVYREEMHVQNHFTWLLDLLWHAHYELLINLYDDVCGWRQAMMGIKSSEIWPPLCKPLSETSCFRIQDLVRTRLRLKSGMLPYSLTDLTLFYDSRLDCSYGHYSYLLTT